MSDYTGFYAANYFLFWNNCKLYRKVGKIVQRISVYSQNVLSINICFSLLSLYINQFNILIYVHTQFFSIVLM